MLDITPDHYASNGLEAVIWGFSVDDRSAGQGTRSSFYRNWRCSGQSSHGANVEKCPLRLHTQRKRKLFGKGRLMRFAIAILVFALSGVAASATSLDDAAKSGDLAEIERLLDEGADVNAAGPFGTALHWASLNGHVEAVELLAERGADLDALSNSLGTPLHAATRRDHADVARALIAAGAKIDGRNPADDFTPLHLAALEGYVATALILIEGGADVNAVSDLDGSTRWGTGEAAVLHLAIRHGHPDIVDALQDAGAMPAKITSIAVRLPDADPVNGRNIAEARCSRCHVAVTGAAAPSNDPAPSLIGVVDRAVASIDDYKYSKALVQFGGHWTPDRLYSFVQHPMLVVPGTEMVQYPELSESVLIDLVGYLVDVSK